MTQDEIKVALRDLSKKRNAGIYDRLTDSLIESLKPEVPRKIRAEELDALRDELEAKLPGWWVVWFQGDRRYGIIPVDD